MIMTCAKRVNGTVPLNINLTYQFDHKEITVLSSSKRTQLSTSLDVYVDHAPGSSARSVPGYTHSHVYTYIRARERYASASRAIAHACSSAVN